MSLDLMVYFLLDRLKSISALHKSQGRALHAVLLRTPSRSSTQFSLREGSETVGLPRAPGGFYYQTCLGDSRLDEA